MSELNGETELAGPDAITPPPTNEAPTETEGQEPESGEVIEGEGGEEGEPQKPAAETAPDDEEFEEVEYGDGKKHKLPKELAPLLMFNADYTRKTQELADQRRSFETERAQLSQMSAERLSAVAKLINAEEQIGRYAKLNWSELQQRDPLGAQAKQIEWKQWEIHRDTLARNIQNYDARSAQEAQQASAKRLEEAMGVIQREIPTWSADIPKVVEYATKLGFSTQELSSISDPRYAKVLHMAMIGQQLLAKQKAAVKQQSVATRPAQQPLPQVTARSGGAPVHKDLSKVSMDQYVKTREAQLARRGR